MRTMALEMPDQDLIALCQSDRNFNNKICQNEEFWRLRMKKYFPHVIPKAPYKEQYQHYLSLSRNGCIFVKDYNKYYVASRINQINLYGIDLIACSQGDYRNIPDGTFIIVYYTPYDQEVVESNAILTIIGEENYHIFEWNEEKYRELSQIQLILSSDLVISYHHALTYRGTYDYQQWIYRHLTKDLEEHLLKQAQMAYQIMKSKDHFTLLTPQGSINYEYDPSSKSFVLQ